MQEGEDMTGNMPAKLATLPTANPKASLQTTSSTYQKFIRRMMFAKGDVRSAASMFHKGVQ